MPVLSKFYGIVIRMLVVRSVTARLHAIYGDTELVVAVDPVRIIQGEAPHRMRDMVIEWATQHQQELIEAWSRLNSAKPLTPIAPLP
jgi:hypothetical protein